MSTSQLKSKAIGNLVRILGIKQGKVWLSFQINRKSITQELQLPATHLNSRFIFAKEQQYFVYQNNFNHYANRFRNTFQHGGISMEEMIIPSL